MNRSLRNIRQAAGRATYMKASCRKSYMKASSRKS
jgi:hypothetical protein